MNKLLVLILSLSYGRSFYLPGVAPNDFAKGASVPLWVNTLSSSETVLLVTHGRSFPTTFIMSPFTFVNLPKSPSKLKHSGVSSLAIDCTILPLK